MIFLRSFAPQSEKIEKKKRKRRKNPPTPFEAVGPQPLRL
jgi:hypothetical protein